MLNYLYGALYGFRKEFSHKRTWLLFTVVVIGFIGSHEMLAITSFCRFWSMDHRGYYALIHFFHSTGWDLTSLMHHWFVFTLSQKCTLVSQGYIVTFGDHTYVPREARRMPGVVTLRQDSETQSKPSYFRGQCWGALALGIGKLSSAFALPLKLTMHQGFSHLGKKADEDTPTLSQQMVMMAIDFALHVKRPVLLVLDAYFSVGPVFNLAQSVWLCSCKGPAVEIIVRAKKSYVAYFQADPSEYLGIGRFSKYGEQIHLMEVFDYLYLFNEVPARIYGTIEKIQLFQMNLLWKPTRGTISFVFALTSHGPIVLMCSNLNQDPIAAIELYCLRNRIEVMFDVLKHLLHAFNCHFWSKSLPKQTRKPRKNKDIVYPDDKAIQKIQSCWNAIEGFVNIAAISLGVLQLVSLKFSDEIWNRFEGYLRTRSRAIPSERTVKNVMSSLLTRNILKVAPTGIIHLIRVEILKQKINQNPFADDIDMYRKTG